MNFFRSILSEDPDPPQPDKQPKSPTDSSQEHDDDPSDQSSPHRDELSPSSNSNSAAVGGSGWSFGGLMKNLATRSESVIETYRRDLKEFGSGLQKETAAIREAASRAVKDLPAPIEVGASVGHAIDGVWKSTTEIIAHGKETLLAPSDGESDSDALNSYSNQSSSSIRYNRFDAQLRMIQSDVSTYTEEPKDLEDYSKWKLGFVMEEKSEEIKSLVEENEEIEGIYKRVVPNVVDHEAFWLRYFYRVHKLKQQENARANLVKRAFSADLDEELSWDVDEEDDDEESNVPLKEKVVMVENEELGSEELPQVLKEESGTNEAEVGSSTIVDDKEDNKPNLDEKTTKVPSEQTYELNNAESASESDEKGVLDGKVDNGGSCKDSDVSIVSTQPSLPEEGDLEWDEIEDLGGNEERKERNDGSPNRAELRKRLSAADEDEDLNWDIEDDDDEPVSKPDSK